MKRIHDEYSAMGPNYPKNWKKLSKQQRTNYIIHNPSLLPNASLLQRLNQTLDKTSNLGIERHKNKQPLTVSKALNELSRNGKLTSGNKKYDTETFIDPLYQGGNPNKMRLHDQKLRLLLNALNQNNQFGGLEILNDKEKPQKAAHQDMAKSFQKQRTLEGLSAIGADDDLSYMMMRAPQQQNQYKQFPNNFIHENIHIANFDKNRELPHPYHISNDDVERSANYLKHYWNSKQEKYPGRYNKNINTYFPHISNLIHAPFLAGYQNEKNAEGEIAAYIMEKLYSPWNKLYSREEWNKLHPNQQAGFYEQEAARKLTKHTLLDTKRVLNEYGLQHNEYHDLAQKIDEKLQHLQKPKARQTDDMSNININFPKSDNKKDNCFGDQCSIF